MMKDGAEGMDNVHSARLRARSTFKYRLVKQGSSFSSPTASFTSHSPPRSPAVVSRTSSGGNMSERAMLDSRYGSQEFIASSPLSRSRTSTFDAGPPSAEVFREPLQVPVPALQALERSASHIMGLGSNPKLHESRLSNGRLDDASRLRTGSSRSSLNNTTSSEQRGIKSARVAPSVDDLRPKASDQSARSQSTPKTDYSEGYGQQHEQENSTSIPGAADRNLDGEEGMEVNGITKKILMPRTNSGILVLRRQAETNAEDPEAPNTEDENNREQVGKESWAERPEAQPQIKDRKANPESPHGVSAAKESQLRDEKINETGNQKAARESAGSAPNGSLERSDDNAQPKDKALHMRSDSNAEESIEEVDVQGGTKVGENGGEVTRFGSKRYSPPSMPPGQKIQSDLSLNDTSFFQPSPDTSPVQSPTIRSMGAMQVPAMTAKKQDKLIVTINCGGRTFQTYVKTLRKFPGTRLANLVEFLDGALLKTNTIFLDRNPKAFSAVLNFYRTDRLVCPASLPEAMWHDELVYYQIENPRLRMPTEEEQEANYVLQGKPPSRGWQSRLWLLLEVPTSSAAAKYLSIWSVFVILVGVMCFIAETHPIFRFNKSKKWYGVTTQDVNTFFRAVEATVVVFFSLELALRIFATTKKFKFFTVPSNIIDIMAVIPFYIDRLPGVDGGSGMLVVRIVRLVRVFRIIGMIFKLGKYSAGARVIGSTMIACLREITILAVVLVMFVVLYASGIYFCENPDLEEYESDFESIQKSMYWAVITLTTVGYGDMVPVTSCGQFVACATALSGIFCLGLPISVITAKFTERYSEMVRDWAIEEERQRLVKIDKQLAATRGVQRLGQRIVSIIKASDKSIIRKIVRSTSGAVKEMIETTDENMVKIREIAAEMFREMDLDGSGEIDVNELGNCMKRLGFELEKDILASILVDIDLDNSGTVDLNEFTLFVEKAVAGRLKANPTAFIRQLEVRHKARSANRFAFR